MADRAPPSRARRLWIQERLRYAHRAIDLLDRKRQILRMARDRARREREEALGAWSRLAAEARREAVRAEGVSGTWALQVAADPLAGQAAMTVGREETVGVAHPGPVRLELPALDGIPAVAAGPVILAAARTHADAIRAAARLAVADATYQRFHTELLLTERRQRAIEKIRVPLLEDELRDLNERLDELERQERIVARWVSDRRAASPPTGPA